MGPFYLQKLLDFFGASNCMKTWTSFFFSLIDPTHRHACLPISQEIISLAHGTVPFLIEKFFSCRCRLSTVISIKESTLPVVVSFLLSYLLLSFHFWTTPFPHVHACVVSARINSIASFIKFWSRLGKNDCHDLRVIFYYCMVPSSFT